MRKIPSIALACYLGVTLFVGAEAAAPANSLSHTVQPPPHPTGPQPASITTNASAQQRLTVAQWFSKYDEIRHQAQMTKDQKQKAHTLITAAFTKADGDKRAAKSLLAFLANRYKVAYSQLSALKSPPETAELQKGYLNYFKTAGNFCQQYLKELSKGQPNVEVLKSARDQVAVIDVSNKLLDHKLRRKYDIQPYQWD